MDADRFETAKGTLRGGKAQMSALILSHDIIRDRILVIEAMALADALRALGVGLRAIGRGAAR